MKIQIISVGDKQPPWVNEGVNEYLKRIRGRLQAQLVEIPAQKRNKNADVAAAANKEAELIKKKITSRARVMALDRKGRSVSTETIAGQIENQLMQGQDMALLIGGPEGFSQEFIQSADEVWSLSAATMAHPVARIVLAEQIYRAYSILENLPYHRGS